ncbi:hypothetical protein F0U62_04865 [Cystobacter fuscus]|uniref:hypothetical protein n=1 Tax=Cystobacter fuscus TaxID=43 RepID=UPI002B27EEC8|nr:hypothetical protein F0U62_04865 [Cystobacter fuscus]
MTRGARALSAVWSRPVLLTAPELLETRPGFTLVRAQVRGGPVPGVLLKSFPDEPVRGFDDRAGAEFLTRRGLDASPRFLAGDVDARLFLLEDPGPGRTLEALLRARDTHAATTGVLATARLLGQLQARTLGNPSEYELLRQTLPPRPERVRMEEARGLLEREERLTRWLTAVGTRPFPGTHEELEAVARALADPRPLLAFTWGHPSPAGVWFTLGGPRLLDLGASGMRHAMWDALPWLVSLPLPEELTARADTTYRLGLSPQCEAAQVDSHWARARATVALARTVHVLQGLHPHMLEEDRPGAFPELSARATLLHHLARCRLWLAPLDDFPGLTRTLEELETRLRERWTLAPFTWPALRQTDG